MTKTQSPKLAPPVLPTEIVDRPRLVERLRITPPGGTAVVTGAPGTGKSVLLTQLAHEVDDAKAWVSLDHGDNDPARFWDLVEQAVRDALDVASPAGERASDGLPADGVIDAVLAASLKGRSFCLVLDDVHDIESPRILAEIGRLLWHLPSSARVFLGSRTDPPLPLARLRVARRLVEVREDDRRFTAADLDALLHAHGVDLDTERRAVLLERTEGWAAGLQLAAVAMQDAPEPAAFVDTLSGSERTIGEYLLDEGLNRQPAGVRRFLLETSILDRFTGSLCDAVTGRASSAAILRRLERDHVFVIRLESRQGDHDNVWYRYHALFSELLRAELAATDPERLAELRRRAGEWFAAHGDAVSAMSHLIAGRHFEAAERLLGTVEIEYFNTSNRATLREWYLALPAEAGELGLRLLRLFWSAALTADVVDTDTALADVREHSTRHPDDQRFAAESQLATAHVAYQRGDADAMRVSAEAARAGFALSGAEASNRNRFSSLLHARASILAGNPEEARATLQTVIEQAGSSDPYISGVLLAGRAYALVLCDDDDAALHTAESAIARLDGIADRGPGGSEAWIARAIVHRRRGRLDAARRDLEHVRAMARQYPAERWYADLADVEQARVLTVTGDFDAAMALLRPLRNRYPVPPYLATAASDALAELQRVQAERQNVGALTARELDVLALLPSRLSLQEIADRLFVSLNTLKSHLRGIYQKLGVGGRDEAVRLAGELHLLEGDLSE